MLAIRLQRVGRKKLAMYRVIVQDAHRSPSSGKVVAYLGSYDPHTQKAEIDTDQAATYLKNGAQPSNRVAMLLKDAGVTLPKWVSIVKKEERATRNPDKLRKNQPVEAEKPAEETPAEPAEASEEVAEEKPAEAEAAPETEAEAEKPADDKPESDKS